MDTTPLHALERRTAYTSKQCAKLLGLGYSTYAAYKAGSIPLPDYVRLHADLLVRVDGDLLLQLVQERIA